MLEIFCLGIAFMLSAVPVFFVWASALRVPLSPVSIIGATATALVLLAVLWRRSSAKRVAVSRPDVVALLAFLFTAGLIFYLRFSNIQGFVLPLWVDSVHHSALARLIAESGLIPDSYRPFAEVDRVYYHVGFHTTVATLAWLSGASVEQIILIFGQVLNALAPVSLYVLASRWTGRAVGGLTAMVVAGVVSLMPAYYVTWGRYTQLEGLVILPLAMLAFDLALPRGANRWLVMAAVLAAGLFLIHYRVVVFYATYVLAALLWQTWRNLRRRDELRSVWLRAAAIAALALLLSAPWLWRILTTAVFPLESFTTRFYSTPEANAIPFDLLNIGTMPALLVAASLGALAALWLGRRHARYVVVVLMWGVLTAVAHNPSWLGLPQLWILENFSTVIALFVPLSLLIALGASTLLDFLSDRFRLSPLTLERAATLLLLVLALWMAPTMTSVVNPVTVLAEPDDILAMDWIRAHTPVDAKFLVNERIWLDPIYAGTDGGYWIPNLTGRRTTMPIVFYLLGPPSYWLDRVNVLGQAIASSPEPDDPSFLALLRANAVTHVYLGAKGGPLSPERFAAGVHYHEIYSQNAVHVFSVDY